MFFALRLDGRDANEFLRKYLTNQQLDNLNAALDFSIRADMQGLTPREVATDRGTVTAYVNRQVV